jgi:hypothetical protein
MVQFARLRVHGIILRCLCLEGSKLLVDGLKSSRSVVVIGLSLAKQVMHTCCNFYDWRFAKYQKADRRAEDFQSLHTSELP